MSRSKNLLNVTYREESGKGSSRRLRKKGFVPAVLYGQGKESKKLQLDNSEWKDIFSADVKMVELKDADGNITNALVQECQYDYLANFTVHVDFLEVKMDEIINSTVVIHPHGIPIGHSQGGMIEQSIHEIEVSCLPANLPEMLEVDVSELELGASILVKDLVLPDGVTVESDLEQIVFHVAQPHEEEESAKDSEEGIETDAGDADANADADDGNKSE